VIAVCLVKLVVFSLDLRQKYFRFVKHYYEPKGGLGKTMPAAFVLINAEIGSEEEVLNEINKVEGVEEAYIVYGVYDIIAKIRANTMDKLKDIVTWNVRRLPKVRSTLTMIIVEGAK